MLTINVGQYRFYFGTTYSRYESASHVFLAWFAGEMLGFGWRLGSFGVVDSGEGGSGLGEKVETLGEFHYLNSGLSV